MSVEQSQSSRWTLFGLALALFSMPMIMAAFRFLDFPITSQNILLREFSVFICVVVLFFVMRRKEKLGFDSIGLQKPAMANTLLWFLIALLAIVAAIALSLGMVSLFGWKFGGEESGSYDHLPLWVTTLIVLRAGVVEEVFYRGYAIERLQQLLGSKLWASVIPLILFSFFHYRQGAAGILIALLTGVVLTMIYLYKRNLWVNISAHFMVDFIPNIVLPYFFGDSPS